jgi:hypothetical protein
VDVGKVLDVFDVVVVVVDFVNFVDLDFKGWQVPKSASW